jgi:hypothetical protein
MPQRPLVHCRGLNPTRISWELGGPPGRHRWEFCLGARCGVGGQDPNSNQPVSHSNVSVLF